MFRICTITMLFFLFAAVTVAETPLSASKLRDWMETRIEETRLQNRMRDNAGRYDDLPRAFFEKRNELVQSRGWDVTDYQNTGSRIMQAYSSLEIKDKLEERAAQRDEERREIRQNDFFTEEQKQQMLEAMNKVYEAQMEQAGASRSDWPAVESYRSELAQLFSWIAGNTEAPPSL